MIHVDSNGFRPDFKTEMLTLDVSEIKTKLSRMDYESILSDSSSFWHAYCLIQSRMQKVPGSLFRIDKLANHSLVIKGKEPIIAKVKEGVEEIRKFLLNRENITLYTIHVASEVYLKEGNDVIDFPEWQNPSIFKIQDQFYNRFIRPCLSPLLEMLGATCKESKKNQKINHGNGELNEMVLKGLSIEWKEEEPLVYPVDPIVILERERIEGKLYEMRQENILCDVKIITQNDVINVHSLIVYAYGDEIMQKILTVGMKEAKEGKIVLKAFPTKIVRAFVDYLYLGANELAEKYLSEEHNIDFYELFKLAHNFQIFTLIDCCTNLISLTAAPGDHKAIKAFADLYENKHLQQLAAHFAQSGPLIKV